MTKSQQEMLALADKIELALQTEGEFTLYETNGTRVVDALRWLADEQEQIAQLQYEAGMYKSLYETVKIARAALAEGQEVAV